MKKLKRMMSAMLIGGMLLSIAPPAAAATNELIMTDSSYITSGAVLKNYTWDIADGNVKASVIEIDLTNPYVQLEVIPGQGKFTQRTSVSKMAGRTGALAAVNGDFYNTKAEGAPIGTTYINGKLASSQSYLNGVYCLGITTDRTAYIEPFGFSGKVTSPSTGVSFPLSGLNKTVYWEETTGAHSHIDRLHLYDDLWGGVTRGQDSYVGVPAEVLIQNNIVADISYEGAFPYPVPDNSYILHGDGVAKDYIINNIQIGDSIFIDYEVTPNQNWSMVIGGHALLVDQGQPVEYTKDLSALKGIRARTAAGISQDGKTVYIIAVEGRTSASKGITLGNLSLLMTNLGIWKAVNLDGGGSTTIVSRPLGETATKQVLAVEGHATERNVVEALGVFSTAPAGAIKGIMIEGAQQLLVGESATYDLKAYDEYYNTTHTATINLAESNGLGSFNYRTFQAEKPGTTSIVATSGMASASLAVKVIGKDDLSKLEVTMADHGSMADGSTHQLAVKATLLDGSVKTVGTNALQWQVEGFDGTIDENGVLTIHSMGDAKEGIITASYDGFSSTLTLDFAGAKAITLQIGSNLLTKEGQTLTMDVAPMIVNDRTMVPIRFISETLGGEVNWVDEDEMQKTVVIYNGMLLELPIQSTEIYVNGEIKTIDVPSQIINDRTMVPLRAIVEGLGMKVDYAADTQTITIRQ